MNSLTSMLNPQASFSANNLSNSALNTNSGLSTDSAYDFSSIYNQALTNYSGPSLSLSSTNSGLLSSSGLSMNSSGLSSLTNAGLNSLKNPYLNSLDSSGLNTLVPTPLYSLTDLQKELLLSILQNYNLAELTPEEEETLLAQLQAFGILLESGQIGETGNTDLTPGNTAANAASSSDDSSASQREAQLVKQMQSQILNKLNSFLSPSTSLQSLSSIFSSYP
ncbi:hypothetical protein ACFL96_00040 [Thermoproteota archaeon]